MRFSPFFAILLLCSSAFAENETAYSALRVVGKAKGEKVLSQVIEVRGRAGAPHPAVWKITTTESMARGGIREYEVQRGKIISERTPTVRVGSYGNPLNLNQLNLDSDGVFTIVNQELQRSGIPFDRIDYTLHSGSSGGSPVWSIEMNETGRGKVASFNIAADTGTILDQRPAPGGNPPLASNDRDYVVDRNPEPQPDVYRGRSVEDDHSHSGEHFHGVGDFFYRLGKRFERRGVQLKRFFTGD